jgi:hypothetical protein
MIVACCVKWPIFLLKFSGTAVVKSLVGAGESSGRLGVCTIPNGHVLFVLIYLYNYIFLFSGTPRPTLWSSQPIVQCVQCVPEALSPTVGKGGTGQGGKRQGRVADSCPPSSSKVNTSGADSIPPYIVMVLWLTN